MVISVTDQAIEYNASLTSKKITKTVREAQNKVSGNIIYKTKSEMLDKGIFSKIDNIKHKIAVIENYINIDRNLIEYMEWVDSGLKRITDAIIDSIPKIVAQLGPTKVDCGITQEIPNDLLKLVHQFMTSSYDSRGGRSIFGSFLQDNSIDNFIEVSNLINKDVPGGSGAEEITANYIKGNLLRNTKVEIFSGYFIEPGIDPYSEGLKKCIGGLWQLKSGNLELGYETLKDSITKLTSERGQYWLKIKRVNDISLENEDTQKELVDKLTTEIYTLDPGNLMEISRENMSGNLLHELVSSFNISVKKSSERILRNLADAL